MYNTIRAIAKIKKMVDSDTFDRMNSDIGNSGTSFFGFDWHDDQYTTNQIVQNMIKTWHGWD